MLYPRDVRVIGRIPLGLALLLSYCITAWLFYQASVFIISAYIHWPPMGWECHQAGLIGGLMFWTFWYAIYQFTPVLPCNKKLLLRRPLLSAVIMLFITTSGAVVAAVSDLGRSYVIVTLGTARTPQSCTWLSRFWWMVPFWLTACSAYVHDFRKLYEPTLKSRVHKHQLKLKTMAKAVGAAATAADVPTTTAVDDHTTADTPTTAADALNTATDAPSAAVDHHIIAVDALTMTAVGAAATAVDPPTLAIHATGTTAGAPTIVVDAPKTAVDAAGTAVGSSVTAGV